MNNVSVRVVFDRKNTATKQHQASIQIEVTYAKRRKYYGTGIRLYSNQFGKDKKIKNHPQSLVLNQQLEEFIFKIRDFVYNQTVKNVEFTFEDLDDALNISKKEEKTNTFLSFMERRICERQVSDSTKIRQRCVLKALKEFKLITDFSDITLQNIRLYDDFAKKRCNCQSSVYNYHKILKIFVKEAYDAQKISYNPYSTFKLDRGKRVMRKFLTREELEKIESKEIENESLDRVRDMFLFCCYTGLAYADLSSFNFNDAVFSNGMYRIRDVRVKTNTPYNISLIDKAINILNKYKFKLPIISNQKYNSYLKVLAAFCDINKKITSHVARHTFATTIALANGVRIEVISKMLGHTNIQTTQLYAHIYQEEVDQAGKATQL